MARLPTWVWSCWLVACGGVPWEPTGAKKFALECAHAEAACESCHPADQPIGPVDEACSSCHLDERPASHDPATTGSCEDCHEGACGWESVGSPHPPGFSEPDQHGLAFDLQDPAEGDCRECHGDDLRGDAAQGCDDCHADAGHPDWRTECTFCHGGTLDPSGAPPQDIDDGTDPASLSFRSHLAHVDADGEYRASPCLDCHLDHADALSAGHVPDDTPAVAEVGFEASPSPANLWSGGTCTDSYCHGTGARADGEVADTAPPMTCDSCHPTTTGWGQMSGFHETHLEEPGIVCNDCHAAIIDRDGVIVTATRHVDGERDVSFFDTSLTRDPEVGTCTGECHGFDHGGEGWGHQPGYEDPGVHGQDANQQSSDCTACHGDDWTGGTAIGCDACHADAGHADWRTDCTFCHGGANGDTEGLPPEDLDNQTDESLISFGAHPEHGSTGTLGHLAYGCEQCHADPGSALTPGHAIDDTPGKAEVDLSGGLSREGGFDPEAVTCSTMYCHGDGHQPSGTITDGEGPLDCDSCHATSGDLSTLSGTHQAHADQGIGCEACHAPVVDSSSHIATPRLHVDRVVQLDEGPIGYHAPTETCTNACHGTNHDGWGWDSPHPPGYDAPELHGQDALSLQSDCASCHGADLRGGSASSCDDCHTADWRSDCVYCHGGANGDAAGLPPQDLDNTVNEAQISFKAHPEHADGDEHPTWGCDTCHGAASRSFSDAFTDPNHWVDSTPGVAEVVFTGDAAGTAYGGGNCTNSWCHGNGQERGSSTDSATALDCNGCHAYDTNRGDLSGTHALHLQEPGVTCADCHAPVVDAAGSITAPSRHVDGAVDVDAASIGFDPVEDTCTVTCHQHDHAGVEWTGGHVAGYDDPLLHGQDALFQVLDCATSGCHGTDLQGGASGQGCDSCHSSPNWREDCTYCHGGGLGDTAGLPPEDLDNTSNQAQISFKSHPEHGDNDDHARFDCGECHGNASMGYADAFTDPNHWFDASIGVAEVSFSGGLAQGGTWVAASSTCNNNYCHGDGQSNGSRADGTTAMTCHSCHPDQTSGNNAWDRMSGEHKKHVGEENCDCSDCHYSVVRNGQNLFDPDLHVNGTIEVAMDPSTNLTWHSGGQYCTGTCHDRHDAGMDW